MNTRQLSKLILDIARDQRRVGNERPADRLELAAKELYRIWQKEHDKDFDKLLADIGLPYENTQAR
jgi:hypothetical protein